jgi:uncharacterized RDD family membrane protein YckC
MDSVTQADAVDEAPPAGRDGTSLSPLWRRWLAFLIDWIILSLGGCIASLILFEPLAALGVWTRLIGFAVATAYFGLFDSGWGGAGSPGKKMIGIRVVDDAGRAIGVGRSLLRAALLCAPVILNNFYLAQRGDYPHLAVNGLLGGWMVATLYVLIFNRGTKQGLHDLATRTFVVRGAAAKPSELRRTFWKPHLMIAAAILALNVPVALAGLPIYLHFSPGLTSRSLKAPTDGPVQVLNAWLSWTPMKPRAGEKPQCQGLRVQMVGRGIDDEAVARRVAAAMVAHYQCHVAVRLPVRLQYGFDMGFASGTAYRDYLLDEADLTRVP